MQQIPHLEFVFVDDIFKVEVKTGDHHDHGGIEKGYKFTDIDFRISFGYPMKQKPKRIDCGNDDKVLIDERVFLIFNFLKDQGGTQKTERRRNEKNCVAEHEPNYLLNNTNLNYILIRYFLV